MNVAHEQGLEECSVGQLLHLPPVQLARICSCRVVCAGCGCSAANPDAQEIRVSVKDGQAPVANAHGLYEGLCDACDVPFCGFGGASACRYEGRACQAAGLTLRRLDCPGVGICSACEPMEREVGIAEAVESFCALEAEACANRRTFFARFL